jgi:hypothetical protein
MANVTQASDTNTQRPDWLTIAAVAIVVHALATLIHEGIGHGGACLAMGCKPQLLTTMQFEGDERSLSGLSGRIISAGGSLANLTAAAVAIALLRRRRNAAARASWFFLWLFATVNLLQAAGYPLYSGVGNIGDWAAVVEGFEPAWLWRIVLAAVGAAGYWMAARWAMDQLGRRLPGLSSARMPEANRYTLVAYATGGALAVIAGLFDPGGLVLVLISGIAASLGGTSALAWGPQLLHDPRLGVPAEPMLDVKRDVRWIVAAAVVAIAFVFVLGPGISSL